jgi:DNA-binding transcriptional regulator YdaS (Cro superfamily)
LTTIQRSTGAEFLSALINQNGLRRLAKLLDAEPSTVSRWAAGKTKPNPKSRITIQRVCGFGANQTDWETDNGPGYISKNASRISKIGTTITVGDLRVTADWCPHRQTVVCDRSNKTGVENIAGLSLRCCGCEARATPERGQRQKLTIVPHAVLAARVVQRKTHRGLRNPHPTTAGAA